MEYYIAMKTHEPPIYLSLLLNVTKWAEKKKSKKSYEKQKQTKPNTVLSYKYVTIYIKFRIVLSAWQEWT